jgi:hypothetical protein
MATPRLNIISANATDLGTLTREVDAFVNQDGYAIIRDVIDPATCAQLIDEVDRVEREFDIPFGNNDFEGFQTRRIFNLIARGPRFRELVIN